ncbi:MAG: hypothetical protein KJO55_01895 [Gammaproteobacteria bacterium]|nr:hypothetical protein [Gammaproteobacteria bacterium]NND60254.1 hypothetical protein [Gammaproteobacteria bacterium]
MLKLLRRMKRESEPEPVEPPTETVGLAQLDDAETVGQVFPGLRHLAVNMSIRAPDHEIEPSLTNRSFGPQSRAYFNFRCKNVECVDGGFDLRDEVSQAVTEGRCDATGRRVCQGWRNAEMAGHQRCYFELNFKIHLSYKE